MLPKSLLQVRNAGTQRWFSVLCVIAVSSLYMAKAFAQDGIDFANPSNVNAQTMLVNIAQNIPNLMRLVTAIGYVLGMYFIIHGVIQLKHLGEARTQMSREHHLMGPMMWLVAGTALLYLPATVQVGLDTFWTDPCPYCYKIPDDTFGDFMKVVYLIIQFVGTIALIRGFVILSHLGSGQSQQGALSKAILHIIGGIFCINIYQFAQVILVTLGIQVS